MYAISATAVIGRQGETPWRNVHGSWSFVPSPLDTVRIRATAPSGRAIFLGIAPATAAARYLNGVAHAVIEDVGRTTLTTSGGSASAVAPAEAAIWRAASSGFGTRTVRWRLATGSWAVVVMNADGSPGVEVNADAGVSVPALPWIVVGLLVGGALLVTGAILLIAIPIRRAAAPVVPRER
jgi:hypothetical protein